MVILDNEYKNECIRNSGYSSRISTLSPLELNYESTSWGPKFLGQWRGWGGTFGRVEWTIFIPSPQKFLSGVWYDFLEGICWLILRWTVCGISALCNHLVMWRIWVSAFFSYIYGRMNYIDAGYTHLTSLLQIQKSDVGIPILKFQVASWNKN